jgi:hypothetical protein
MAESVATPLQLTAGVGFYAGNAITANTALSNNVANYNALAPIANLLYTINEAVSNTSLSISANTIANLKTLGANVSGNYCPCLGDSVPSNISLSVGNAGYATTITTAASTYLGSGDFGKFAQAFGAAQGYISLTNAVINSAVNANSTDFLGPTFSNMNNLISGDIAKINLAFPAFGADLAQAGELFALDNLDYFGTPAGLLNQVSLKGNIVNSSTPCVVTALKAQGLTDKNIADLVNINVQSLFNPDGLSENQFNTLQKRAYPGLVNVAGTCVQEVLDILDCTLPNIGNVADLLDPVMIFPTSYPSLTLPTANGPVLIYQPTATATGVPTGVTAGTVNSAIAPILNSGSLTPKGCDELGKIVPQAQAAASRALQIAFQQVKGISNTTVPQLAAILQ